MLCNFQIYVQEKPTKQERFHSKGDDCCIESSVLHLTEQIIDTCWVNVLVNLKIKSDGDTSFI